MTNAYSTTQFVKREDLDRVTLHLVLVGIAICLVLQAWLALVMEINWDEFFYLSHIYSYQRGELTKVLQFLHVHLFGWITWVPGDEINQIIVGRMVMLACFTGTCILVFLLSRNFTSKPAAMVAALVLASSGFSTIHGASFRADPIAALLTMSSLVVIARARPNAASMAIVAALGAVAAMITVKVVLYAPAFIGVAVWRILDAKDRRRMLLWFSGIGFSAAVIFGLLYILQLSLRPQPLGGAANGGFANAAETQFSGAFLPRARETLQFVVLSPIQTVLLVTGFVATIGLFASTQSRVKAIAALGCGSTVLCVLFYRNAFPYFFPFILPPTAVLAATAVDAITLLRRRVVLLVIVLPMSAILVAVSWSQHGLSSQRQIVTAVHAMFPEPVKYIDRNGMISAFPKRGFFMSTWGMQNYRWARKPVFDTLLRKEVVPLVVANGPALENALGGWADLPTYLTLFEDDKATLRDNYIPHWGPIWVAGKSIVAPVQDAKITILVPGLYTVEGGAVSIDDRHVAAGDTLTLVRGEHRITAEKPGVVRLRWGSHLNRPDAHFIGPIYQGF